MSGPEPERLAGTLIPLFSIGSTQSWGIGEFCDLPGLAKWLHRAGLRVLQLLPLHETGRDEYSPYSPISAMAIDPQYITLRAVQDFQMAGGEASLDENVRSDLSLACQSTRVDYRRVRAAKDQALHRAFDRFIEEEWTAETPRARQLRRYAAEQAWWLEPYALFRALRSTSHEQSWRTWPEPLQGADPTALEEARAGLRRDVLFYKYVQWIAEQQWQAARRAARPAAIFGDFPFLVTIDSADVWSRQQEFLISASVGAPPDAFTTDGQDWGLPPCNWERMAHTGDGWLRHRIRRMAALFDGCRIDHLVGFYRTYIRPHGAHAYFAPASEPEQLQQGERLMRMFLESGQPIIVEDLGNVPPFVRTSLERLGLPGYRVMRWERRWHQPGQPFIDPAQYPPVSVATTGTHDTDTMAEWWESLTSEERADIVSLPTVRRVAGDGDAWADGPFTDRARDILLEALYASGSNLLILPVQDLFGWRDRINEPGTIDDKNWTFKLPWPIDRLDSAPEATKCAERLRIWADRYGRI